MARMIALLLATAGVAHATPARLRKAEVKATLKGVFPSLTECYQRELARDPKLGGVVNTKLTIRNEPGVAMTMTVTGFETSGSIGQSKSFLACVKNRFEGRKFAPTATRGSLDMMYPGTFATTSPGDRDKAVVESAELAASMNRWADVLGQAARGLELTSLDGPWRRRLIEIAGLSACHLRDEANARRYFLLASPEFEDRVYETCLNISSLDLLK